MKDFLGSWRADPAHSTFRFAVRHMQVGLFHGEVRDFDAFMLASMHQIRLVATGAASSLTTRDEHVRRALLGPDFFDAERYPMLQFASGDVSLEGRAMTVSGELTMKNVTRQIVLRGEVAGPVVDPFGVRRIGLELRAVVDRTEWGIDWNAVLPGGRVVLGTEVRLEASLELVEGR